MREIKFRAWDKQNKNMVGGFHCMSPRMSMFITQYSIDFEQYDVMQYTGLKDKNGKEIYEGDVITYSGKDERVVAWSEKTASFWGFQDYTDDGVNNIEIIGNIYEDKV